MPLISDSRTWRECEGGGGWQEKGRRRLPACATGWGWEACGGEWLADCVSGWTNEWVSEWVSEWVMFAIWLTLLLIMSRSLYMCICLHVCVSECVSECVLKSHQVEVGGNSIKASKAPGKPQNAIFKVSLWQRCNNSSHTHTLTYTHMRAYWTPAKSLAAKSGDGWGRGGKAEGGVGRVCCK